MGIEGQEKPQVNSLAGLESIRDGLANKAKEPEVQEQEKGGNTDGLQEGRKEEKIVEEYKPNFKYKVLDDEFEFDDVVKSAIKAKDHEDKFRDLYTKAHGLEATKRLKEEIKQKYEIKEKEYTKLKEDYDSVESLLAPARQLLEADDILGSLEQLGYTKQHILRAAEQAQAFDTASKEEIRAYEAYRNNALNSHKAESEKIGLEKQYQDLLISHYQTQIGMEVSKPDTQNYVDAIDKIYGKPGYFLSEVATLGDSLLAQGQKPSVAEVFGMVKSKFKPVVELYKQTSAQPAAPAQDAQAANSSNAIGESKAKASTMPNLKSGGSPVKAQINTMAGLEARLKELKKQ